MGFDYDVIIVGLGPAGATLCRLLAPHMRVLALDRKTQTGGFDKPCGGLLAPDAQKALARFGLTLPNRVLADPQIFCVDVLDLDSGLRRRYQRFYVNMDRRKFDRWLISLIPAAARVCENAVCTALQRCGGGFGVEWTDAQGPHYATARYVVGADGAHSLVRRTFFPARKPRLYVALQQWFKDEHPSPSYGCVFDAQNTDCYSWHLSKDGWRIFGGAYPAHNCRARFENQKKKLSACGLHFTAPLKTEACLVLCPTARDLLPPAQAGVFLTGEAAGWVSPSSLEGISAALNGARLLARALYTHTPEKTYNRLTLPLRLKLLAKLLKCPLLYRPFLRKIVMKSRLHALPEAVPDKPL